MKFRTKLIITLLILSTAGIFSIIKFSGADNTDTVLKEIHPFTGSIKQTVSTTGTVLPRNRLELKPSTAGRIEKILVREGDVVKKGQILALMSSTDRAALIDAARLQGDESLKYWEKAYKPISIVAPIDGTVIVRSVEPGQTVTTSDNIIIISDRLIVKAQVDETDIARVKIGQSADITLDSHPEIVVRGKVSHIYYESTTVNNVTVYYVIIIPDRIPPEYRSGMSASIEIIEKEKKDILMIPVDAISAASGKNYVMVRTGDRKPPEKRAITTGMKDEQYMEVTGGININDVIIVTSKKPAIKEAEKSKNPFMPEPPGVKKK
jgi:macrolide-specific efflux system membrane fusion protein